LIIFLIEWYQQTPDNNLLYWGLDYPPLTAYHAWLCGKIAQFYEPEMVKLNTSRGYETLSSKLYMRASSLIPDIIIYFVAIWYFVYHSFYKHKSELEKLSAFLLILIQPGLILIDHGHFQYNSISLGFAVGAIGLIINNYDVAGSVLFCLSLNYKQMSLYYAPAFFFLFIRKKF